MLLTHCCAALTYCGPSTHVKTHTPLPLSDRTGTFFISLNSQTTEVSPSVIYYYSSEYNICNRTCSCRKIIALCIGWCSFSIHIMFTGFFIYFIIIVTDCTVTHFDILQEITNKVLKKGTINFALIMNWKSWHLYRSLYSWGCVCVCACGTEYMIQNHWSW